MGFLLLVYLFRVNNLSLTILSFTRGWCAFFKKRRGGGDVKHHSIKLSILLYIANTFKCVKFFPPPSLSLSLSLSLSPHTCTHIIYTHARNHFFYSSSKFHRAENIAFSSITDNLILLTGITYPSHTLTEYLSLIFCMSSCWDSIFC